MRRCVDRPQGLVGSVSACCVFLYVGGWVVYTDRDEGVVEVVVMTRESIEETGPEQVGLSSGL